MISELHSAELHDPVTRPPARGLPRSVGWLMASHLATVAVGFVTSIVIAHAGAEELGRWRFAQAILTYLMVGTDAGLTMLAVREIARRPADVDGYAGPVVFIRLGLAVVALTAAVLIVSPGPDNPVGWFYVAMFLLVVPAALSLTHVAQGLERLRAYALVRFVSGALAGLAGLLAFLLTHELVSLVLPVLAVGLVVDLGLLLYLRATSGVRLRLGLPRLWRGLVVPAFPFLAGALAIQLVSNADALIIGSALGEGELGLYAAAYVIAGQSLLLSGPISLAAYPRLASLHAGGSGFERAVRELSGVLGLVVLPACVGLALVAPSLVATIYGQGYERSILLLTILMGMPLIGFYNGAIGQALNAAGLQGTVARVAALAAGVNVLVNLALVPTVGLTGAALAAVLTEIVTATAYTRAVRPLAGFAPIRAYVATADAVVIMAVLLVALPDLALPVTILIGVAAYLAVVLVRRPASLVAVSRMIGR